jgi:hypothetical protein
MLHLWDVGEEGAACAGGEEKVGRGQRARMASSDDELACDGRWLRRSLLSSRYNTGSGQGIAPWSRRGTSSSAMEAASSWKGCADEGIWPPEK